MATKAPETMTAAELLKELRQLRRDQALARHAERMGLAATLGEDNTTGHDRTKIPRQLRASIPARRRIRALTREAIARGLNIKMRAPDPAVLGRRVQAILDKQGSGAD